MATAKKFTKLIFSAILATVTMEAYSQTIKGRVTDAATGEPLVGATVVLKGISGKAVVKLDGSFHFKNLKPGDYELMATYIGYSIAKAGPIHIKSDNDIEVVDIQAKPLYSDLSAITVVGSKNEESGTRHLEQNANQVVNILSSKTLQLLPDITVANALQRVSGVTIEKGSSGEGRYPIIRGMDKRYINTLVNNIKIPSPDNKSRFIPLDLFPSELLERLEVSKSLTPSMEGDAIGGTINLVMKDAPASKLLQVNFSGGYNNIFGEQPFQSFSTSTMNKRSPNQINGATYAAKDSEFPLGHMNYNSKSTPINTTAGLTIGNRFGKNKELGVILSGSYQNQYRGTATSVFSTATTPNVDNIPSFEYLRERKYSTQTQRIGVSGKVDYRFNQRNKISLFSTYVNLDDRQVRESYDTTNAINQTLSYSSRTTWQYQSIYNATLQGEHQLNNTSKFDWSAAYSIAKNSIPDQTSFSHGGLSVDRTGSTVKLNGDDILSSMNRSWMQNSDRDLSFYANYTKETKLLNRFFELKGGVLYRHKNRDNFYNYYTLNPLRINGNNQLFTSVDAAKFTFIGSDATAQLNGNNYTFNEDISAAYLQGKWQLTNQLEALGGLRVEHTYQQYNTQLPATADYKDGKITYTDLLPSLQLKYQLLRKQTLRLSYYKAIARPQFSELIPDGPDNYELFKERGNPEGLQHSTANNFDFRYELFPGKADQLLLGVFYKRIDDPIELSVRKFGYNTQVFKPVNIGTAATNYGFEAVFIKYIGSFGISANYTYTHSRITNDSMLYKYRDPQLGITDKYISETRPMQGQANHIGNLSLLYKNTKTGTDLQVAVVYTGERLAILNTYAGLHYWLQPTTQLDLSFEQRIYKKFTFYGKINNLTNTPNVTAMHLAYNSYLEKTSVPLSQQSTPNDKIVVQKDYYKTSFLFGFRYKL
ncbi:TonB-dependent receptor [Chitinophaga silvatica]|uniref:TonB-dependent receptor n=1 Tax=Chitinophaga silvatica TaxID=2282649 RepID=A0A3E1Y8U7_9BACT|nr:TonB-dependent receptor [Chitinophaga silvatica]RFS21869.1 TonB-dependent receptor [Chitinophaga silvatica]